jgi:hypothetical protein
VGYYYDRGDFEKAKMEYEIVELIFLKIIRVFLKGH